MHSDVSMEIGDTIFPSGYVEIVFNLGEAVWQSTAKNGFQTDPPVEFLGQITKPMAIRANGKNDLLGVRFYAHAISFFLDCDMWELNDEIADMRDILQEPIQALQEKLLNETSFNKKIELVENFLLNRLSRNENRLNRITMMGGIINDMERSGYSSNIADIASRYGISSRYLQKLFLEHVGVTPKLYNKINRFRHSLRHIGTNQNSLTSVAYQAGYADQSHFIRDFKSFAGITPSEYSPEHFPISAAIL